MRLERVGEFDQPLYVTQPSGERDELLVVEKCGTVRLLRDGEVVEYTGGTVALLGLALLLDTATGIAVVAVLAFVAHGLVLAEEHYLEARFGDEYREYCSRVRRWI